MVGAGFGNAKTVLLTVSMLLCSCMGMDRRHLREEDKLTSPRERWSSGTSRALTDSVAQQTRTGGAASARPEGELRAGEPIWVQSGKSRVIRLASPVKRLSIGDPDLAGLVVLTPRTIIINAKEIGKRAPSDYGAGAPRTTGVVSGRTLTPEPRVAETTLIVWDGSAAPDVHSLFIADFINQQVMLEVTVAELKRSAFEEHGIDFRQMAETFASAYFLGGGAGAIPLGSIGSAVPPHWTEGTLPLGPTSSKPTYAFNLPKEGITAFIQLLQSEGLATVLAQPQMLAMSGQNALFQVGGEIPIRIATGFTSDVQFKPFGTIVNFLPRVSEEGDIMLTVTPEVSEPDFSAAVEGIPSFRTRRASTSTRLRDGETLVIAGLLQRTRNEQVQGVPYLQDIPVVGYVFRHTTHTEDVTELIVVVTPHVVRTPFAPGEEIPLVTDRIPLTDEEIRTQPNPAEVTRPRIPGMP